MLKTAPRLAWFFFVVALVFPSPEIAAQRKQGPVLVTAPPQPVAQSVKVERGGHVEIPLRIYGQQNEPLTYLVRVPPQHGRVSEPRVLSREVSVITYAPPADLAVTRDRFKIAVRNSNGVSASVEIKVEIVDLPAQLTMPDFVTFPAIPSGNESTKTVEIYNRGGGMAIGEAIVNSPWRIEGNSAYRLGAGDSASFKVIFSPKAGGTYDSAIRYSSDPEHSTALHGEALALIIATPERITLDSTPGDTTRTGLIELRNQTDQDRTLKFSADPRLVFPPEITVPANGSATVSLRTVADDAEPLETELRGESPAFTLVVPVKAPRPSAFLRVKQATLDFKRVKSTQAAEEAFDLENNGGTAAGVNFQITTPFTLPQASAILLPGESKHFRIALPPSASGKYRATLRITSETQTLETLVQAEIADASDSSSAAAPTATRVRTSASPTPGSLDAPLQAPVEAEAELAKSEPIVPREWLPDPAPPQGVALTEIHPKRAILEWPAALSPEASFQVQWRNLKLDAEDKLVVTWENYTIAKVTRIGDHFRAELPGLSPLNSYAIRVLPLRAGNETGPRLFAVEFRTPPAPSLVPTVTPFRIFLVVLVVFFGFKIWRKSTQPRLPRSSF